MNCIEIAQRLEVEKQKQLDIHDNGKPIQNLQIEWIPWSPDTDEVVQLLKEIARDDLAPDFNRRATKLLKTLR